MSNLSREGTNATGDSWSTVSTNATTASQQPGRFPRQPQQQELLGALQPPLTQAQGDEEAAVGASAAAIAMRTPQIESANDRDTPTHRKNQKRRSPGGFGAVDGGDGQTHPDPQQLRQQQQPRRPSESFEIDQQLRQQEIPSSSSSSSSWKKRISWIQRRPMLNLRQGQVGELADSLDYQAGEAVYRGSSMESYDDSVKAQPSTGGDNAVQQLGMSSSAVARSPLNIGGDPSPPLLPSPPELTKQSSFQRIASWLTPESQASIDFRDDEWTPPDSSYGAAIPVGGWIPKNIRRLIEWTVIGSFIVAICYGVITTSIRISEEHYNNSNRNRNNTAGNVDDDYNALGLDDDRYVEYQTNDDDVMKAVYDDDASNNNDDAYAAKNGDDDNGNSYYYNNNDDSAYAANNDDASGGDDDAGGGSSNHYYYYGYNKDGNFYDYGSNNQNNNDDGGGRFRQLRQWV